MAAGEQMVSRVFGLTPYSQDTVMPVEIFRKFSSVVNLMIRYGVRLDKSVFKYDQLISVKRFYDRSRNLPGFSKKLKFIGLRERANRCAAQFSYFSIREHKIRADFISVCSRIIKDSGIFCLFGDKFPTNGLLKNLRSKIKDLGYDSQYQSRIYLENVLKHTRNLLKQKLKVKLGKPIKTYLHDKYKINRLSSYLTKEVHLKLQVYLTEFCDRLKHLISKRIKNIHKEMGVFFGKKVFDPLIIDILGENGISKKKWLKNLEELLETNVTALKYQLQDVFLPQIVQNIISKLPEIFTPSYIANRLFYPNLESKFISGWDLESFLKYLHNKLIFKAEKMVITEIKHKIQPSVHKLMEILENHPEKWLKRPVFKKHTIPFGCDDGQVYSLEIECDEEARNIEGVILNLSFSPRTHLKYSLNTVDRFQIMLDSGYTACRGTLSRKMGGGLQLSVPFKKKTKKVSEIRSESPIEKIYSICGVDLGLKTLAVSSISNCTQNKGGTWKRIGTTDNFRKFIDLVQFSGSRESCFHTGLINRNSIFNFKRRLVNLWQHARRLQQKRSKYRNNHPKNYSHKVKYARLRREWKRTWNKIRNMHIEMSNQVATRIVALCQYYNVDYIRLEDLSWSKHSSKNSVGYFLATWQIHWFFSRIQGRIKSVAAKYNIKIEMVKAGGTSQQCSRCGKTGKRTRKQFICHHCGFSCDSDLNAARNITTAQLSYSAISAIGG
jgi:transposase